MGIKANKKRKYDGRMVEIEEVKGNFGVRSQVQESYAGAYFNPQS